MNMLDKEIPNLTLNDLFLTVKIIQLGAKNSIFSLDEYKTVGDLYERIVGVLVANGVIQQNEVQFNGEKSNDETRSETQ